MVINRIAGFFIDSQKERSYFGGMKAKPTSIDLREAYERYLAKNHSEGTRRIRRGALSRWEEFLRSSAVCKSSASTLTTETGGNTTTLATEGVALAVELFDDELLADWAEYRLQSVSADTLRKEWDSLHQIFARLGPRGPGNPKGLSLLDLVPSIDLPKKAAKDYPRLFDREELARLWKASSAATWPRKADPPAIWRAIFSLGLTYGLGFAELARFDRSWIHFGERVPELNGRAICPHGWLKFQRTKNGRPVVVPLSRVCFDALQAISSEDFRLGIENSQAREFGREFKKIREAASVDPAFFRALRKSCNDTWNAAPELPQMEGLGGLGRWILGHRARDVNDSGYASVQHHIASNIDRFPYPWEASQ